MKKQKTQNEKPLIFKMGLVIVFLMIFTFTNMNAMNAITQANKANETTFSWNYPLNISLLTTQGDITFMPVEAVVENNEQLSQLLYGINPTVFITAEGIGQDSHEVPVVAVCRDNAVNSLEQENDAFKEVKALHIYIDEPNFSDIDLSKLSDFTNLEYIVISFTYDVCGNFKDSCILTLVQNMIKAGDKPMTILYQLSIPQ